MLTRAMMLALGQEASLSLGQHVAIRKANVIAEASISMNTMWDDGITSKALLSLADSGKTLADLEKAAEKLAYFNENFSTGGVAPKERTIRRRERTITVKMPKSTE